MNKEAKFEKLKWYTLNIVKISMELQTYFIENNLPWSVKIVLFDELEVYLRSAFGDYHFIIYLMQRNENDEKMMNMNLLMSN